MVWPAGTLLLEAGLPQRCRLGARDHYHTSPSLIVIVIMTIIVISSSSIDCITALCNSIAAPTTARIANGNTPLP